MKKFLSLLLALTLVLSLVVVPARAHDGEVTLSVTKTTIEVNESSTITATPGDDIVLASGYPKWSLNESAGASLNATDGSRTATVTGTKAETVTVTCKYKLSTDESSAEEKSVQKQITVNAPDCTHAVKSIKVNGIKTGVTASGATNTADYYTVTGQTIAAADFTTANIEFKTGFSKGDGAITLEDNTLSIPVTTGGEHPTTGTTTITLTPKVVAVPTIAITPVEASRYVGQNLKFTATATNAPEGASYVWTYGGSDSTAETASPLTNAKTNEVTIAAPAAGNYKVFCKVTFGGVSTATSAGDAFTTLADPYEPDYNKTDTTRTATISPNTNAGLAVNKTWPIPMPRLKNTTQGSTEELIPGTTTGCSVKFTSNDTAVATVNQTSGLVTAGTKAGNATITAVITYNGKIYAKTLTYTVRNRVLEATLAAVQNNTATYLDGRNYYGNLGAAAQAALIANSISGTVSTVALNTASVTNGRITGTNYYYTFTGSSIGVSTFTGTVTLTNGSVYTMTFKVPVTPISTTYEAQYPEPVAYGNTYRYYVQVPAGASYYYVVGTPNQATIPTDFSQSGKTVYYANTTSTNLYPLTDSNFVNGQCTLWIVTKNSSDNRLYYGQLTVYQKNYNINYNGVAGETVQFAQSDFTDFMNEVAEARGDASKTKSYPYVTFDYVTFSLPTTSQGTLYYGGTAMSTSNSSGAFNTRTKVTNLDSVTFVPNAKTTAKTITLNFTLYATRYSSSSTSHGTTVSYSGSVVVNLVREDIKYTVSQGDSVRFDESDFLSYLRSTKGYTSNYTIDYVTFDQSAVSAVNEGSLYTYYNGYNYGGSVKTTDKFYYNATASQNALSDVAFLASRYAKTGETVYIPFTIYARYGSTGTGTRQLTGTVAIKIGQTMNFIDVKTTDYFYNSVKWAVGKNITNGTSSTTFSPYKSCTRAEIVTFLWRAAGSPEPTITRNPFRDVNAVTHSSYYKAILWASQKGITSGTSATAFSPDQVCTRAQIVTFLYRYAGQPSGYYSNPFKDVGATSEASYYNAILWAVGKGITTGTSATTFSPYASCNRAEAVTFLYRYTNGL